MNNGQIANIEAIGLETAETFGSDSTILDFGLAGSHSGGGYATSSCLTVDICPDLLFAAIAAAAAAGFYLIYEAITVKGRRRKRSLFFNRDQTSIFNFDSLTDVYLGMCYFYK